ncbi:tyrosine-protein phosphatase CDC14-like [Aricia agestis]|uniref:tyrosine-protein phosphatase CDC14-like n=1 Tax=Aricia agestis TaxID=91739 RepID=UPI001C206CCC|nr:tyrosine-protein phosphatase CDC14-like [Aricia agestis]
MSRNPDIIFLTEYIKNVLYFAVFKSGRVPVNCCNTHYFCIDDDLIYENYYLDFGPLNLGCVYKYYKLLNDKINLHSQNQVLIHYTSADSRKKANAAFLIGCFGVLYLCLSADQAYKPLLREQFVPFQDACQQKSPYTITILDCLEGLAKARDFNFFNFQDFNVAEYIKLDKLQGGDLNWIIPGKFLAFIGPVDNTYSVYNPPEMYVAYFIHNNVKVVIRLNKRLYDSNTFTSNGILHYDLYFPDGSCPQKHIVMKFLEISEETTGAIAVHCKAGLGRTGTLIGSYLIKHYRMSAHEAIAWMRICRPGSVIGHQQEWLEKIEPWLIKQGNIYRRRMFQDVNQFPKHEYGIYSFVKTTYLQRAMLSKSSTPTSRRKLSPSELSSGSRPISRKMFGEVEKNFKREDHNWHQKSFLQNQKIIIDKEKSFYKEAISKDFSKTKNIHDCETHVISSRPSRFSKHLKSIKSKGRNDDKAPDRSVQYSCAKQNRQCQLQNLIKISTPQYRLSEFKYELTNANIFAKEEPKELLQPQFRRRLGRSPSPPVTRMINEPTIASNSVCAQQLRKSNSNEKKINKPKVSKHRRGSVGGVSLDAQKSAPMEHRASSVRSDERPTATQGDLLNGIKFSRRLKESLKAENHSKTFDKSSMTPLRAAWGPAHAHEPTFSTTKEPKLNKKGSGQATVPQHQGSIGKPNSRANSPKITRPALTTFY